MRKQNQIFRSVFLTGILVFVLSTAASAQETMKSEFEAGVQSDLKFVIDLWHENWLRTNRDIDQLEDICKAYLKIGEWQQAKVALEDFPLPKDPKELHRVVVCINDVHCEIAMQLSGKKSVAKAYVYLQGHIVRTEDSNPRPDYIASHVEAVAGRLARKGETSSLLWLEQIPWNKELPAYYEDLDANSKRQEVMEYTLESLAGNGGYKEALAFAMQTPDPVERNNLLLKVVTGAVGHVSHAEIESVIEEIDSPEFQNRIIESCFDARSGYFSRISKRSAADLLKFGLKYGDQHPEDCLQMATKMCSRDYAGEHWRAILEMANAMYLKIPEDRWSSDTTCTICECYFNLGFHQKSFELAAGMPGPDEVDFRSLSFFSMSIYDAKRIAEASSAEQIEGIVNAYPDRPGDKLEFISDLLHHAADLEKEAVCTFLIDQILKIKRIDLESYNPTSKLDQLKLAMNVLAREAGNISAVVNLATHLDSEIDGISPKISYWWPIALAAHRHGRSELFEYCLSKIESGKQAHLQLEALCRSGDQAMLIEKLNAFLEGKEVPPFDSSYSRRSIAINIIFAAIMAENFDNGIRAWQEISRELTDVEHNQIFTGVSFRFLLPSADEADYLLNALTSIEEIIGATPKTLGMRCSLNIVSGELDAAEQLFSELMDLDPGFKVDSAWLLERFVGAGRFEPLEVCLDSSNEPDSIKVAIRLLSDVRLSQSDLQGAIELVNEFDLPEERCDYLQSLYQDLAKLNR